MPNSRTVLEGDATSFKFKQVGVVREADGSTKVHHIRVVIHINYFYSVTIIRIPNSINNEQFYE